VNASPLTILAIETSCDDTAAAIVTSSREILANEVHTQLSEHSPYGGVVPEIAARAHMEYLESVVSHALKQAQMQLKDIDALAVTSGPGLIGGVIVGVIAAKAYASVLRKPLYGINHLEGHALTARLTHDVQFPYLLMLMSGGHCQIFIVEAVGSYHLLGGTLDDALGEAFDKTAKMMGLPYPGGPHIERIAAQGNPHRFDFPRPLTQRAGCDFSFSGLKTAVRIALQQLHANQPQGISEQDRADIAASFQATAAAVLDNRLRHAIQTCLARFPQTKQLVLAGGVAANMALRTTCEATAAHFGLQLIAPPIKLCTDNAAMIAWAAHERITAGFTPDSTIEPVARWAL
jgi:N6-L-threonylcarbamoyladenine synthase